MTAILYKSQDVLDSIFELLVFCFYYGVIGLIRELFELCIGRWILLKKEAAKPQGFPSKFLVDVASFAQLIEGNRK